MKEEQLRMEKAVKSGDPLFHPVFLIRMEDSSLTEIEETVEKNTCSQTVSFNRQLHTYSWRPVADDSNRQNYSCC